MQQNPIIRSFVVALALVGALAGLLLSLGRPLHASLEGALLALLQRAENAPAGASVLWVDSAAGGEVAANRGDLAGAIAAAARGRARAIVLAQPLERADANSDLARVRAFLDSPEAAQDPALRTRLQGWAAELDYDARLERALREAGNVVLVARAKPDATLRPAASDALGDALLAAAPAVLPPLDRFAQAARAIGVEPAHAPDADGVLRRDALLLGTDGGAAPSLAFAAWAVANGGRPADATREDDGLAVGEARLQSAANGVWVPWYTRGSHASGGLAHATLADLAGGRVPPEAVANRVVVIAGDAAAQAVPIGTLTVAEATAQRIASLLDATYARAPGWAPAAAVLVALFAIAWASLLAPRLPPVPRALATLGLVVACLGLEAALLASAREWVPLFVPALAFPVATLAVALLPEPRAARDDTAALPSPHELAAMAKPPAAAAPGAGPPRARIPPPRPAAAPASEPSAPARGDDAASTAALPRGPAPPSTAAHASGPSLREISESLRTRRDEPSRAEVADLLLGRAKRPPKPKLGRYELERELGRGAMGTVYLGRDPHINRVLAIKAIPIAEEFEGEALVEARARFFREAEMAGRLQHPGIVTVYDAGEDRGIAYIAMEYIQGRILADHAVSDRLLPPAQVLEIVARIADALDFAHRQDIVHRDVKPANVIFDPNTLDTKIMDFGIARLTNSSATRTGIVLGTPSFMSPEQLEGRSVNGRSDLFSLGVTLFQLLAGQLPFRADSMTGLMDKISNAPHPPLRTIRPDLPPCVGLIVDRALAKDPANRFPTAAEMARALRACARSLSA
jgi:serine/threonine-protein kinase